MPDTYSLCVLCPDVNFFNEFMKDVLPKQSAVKLPSKYVTTTVNGNYLRLVAIEMNDTALKRFEPAPYNSFLLIYDASEEKNVKAAHNAIEFLDKKNIEKKCVHDTPIVKKSVNNRLVLVGQATGLEPFNIVNDAVAQKFQFPKNHYFSHEHFDQGIEEVSFREPNKLCCFKLS